MPDMRCHWVKDPEVDGGRYLVPGCMHRAVYGDDAMCTCVVPPKKLPAEARDLMEKVADLQLTNDQLDEAWAYLRKIRITS